MMKGAQMFFIQLTQTNCLDPGVIWVNVEAIDYFGTFANESFIHFRSEDKINVAETPKQILERIPSDYK